MNVQIQSVKFDASKQLLEFIQKKMDRLDRFVDERAGDVARFVYHPGCKGLPGFSSILRWCFHSLTFF